MVMGRPTKYDPDYCQKVLEYGKEGAHVYEMAMYLDINVDTLYQWAKDYPDFSESFTRAKQYACGWLEKQARENLGNKNFQNKVYEFKMRMQHKRGTGQGETGLNLPNIKNAESWGDKSKALADYVASGSITTHDAVNLSKILTDCAKTEEVTELRERLERLEDENAGT